MPGRYHFEMRALAEVVGDTLRIDEEALAKGTLSVEFGWPLDGQLISLQAIFPDSFPRLRPIVRLRDRAQFPRRHCSPIDGTLCLLGRDTRQWQFGWTLRKLLDLQLADALSGAGEEDPQGEPAEYWWNSLGRRGSYCLIDSAWTLKGTTSGTLKIRYGFQKQDPPEIKAVVTEVLDKDGNILQTWNGLLPPQIGSGVVSVPWIYIDETILPDGSAEQIPNLIARFNRPSSAAALNHSIDAQWYAVIYKTEVDFNTFGLGWLFLLLYGPKKAFRTPKRGMSNPRRPRGAIIPSYRAGEQDLGARVPAVQNLRGNIIAVVGLGALGAPLAIELARNGCKKLYLLDHDLIEPGNSIRWPLGASAWGMNKTDSLAHFIRHEYPWTEVVEMPHPVGAFGNGDPGSGDDTIFDAIVPHVDLVVDATASYGVSTILSDYCRKHGVPLVSLYASPPVEGGAVACFAPNSGCPTCLEFAYAEQIIERAPGFGNDEALRQPPGCAELTFTGASYDLQELSLQAMRLIVQTLENPEGSRSSVVHTLSLVADGKRIPPAWRVAELQKAEMCSCATAL